MTIKPVGPDLEFTTCVYNDTIDKKLKLRSHCVTKSESPDTEFLWKVNLVQSSVFEVLFH